jgi:hypothetical protein
MSEQLHDGWLDTVATDPDSHFKDACWTLRNCWKRKIFCPSWEWNSCSTTFHPILPIHGADYWAVRLFLACIGISTESRTQTHGMLTALYFCMLCISTVSREELLKLLIICSPGDKHVWELEDVDYNICINIWWVVLLHVTHIWGNVRPEFDF